MGTTQRRGLRLVATDGHSHWAEPTMWVGLPQPLSADNSDNIYYMGIECSFGGVPMVHFIARDGKGAACWQSEPYCFASIEAAEAARDELAAQTSGEGE